MSVKVCRNAGYKSLRGVSEDGEDVLEYLPKLEESFKNIGIQIRKDENTFKSTYEIMSDLASVWENLTDVQRANMAELTAGKRQGNIVMAMMTNYKDMQDSLTTALNSTNSALIENEKYMESIEAKSAQFKNTVMGKWQEALNSNVIKNFVVAMTTLVEVLGNTEVIIGLLITAFLLWKGTAITGVISALISLIATEGVAAVTTMTLTDAVGLLTVAFNTLKATMATNPLGLLAVVATTAMVAIYGLTNATKKHREEQQKQIETSQNQIQNLKQQKEGLKELTSEYETLKDKEKNLTATTEEKKRLLEIQKELVDKYGVSATGINLEGQAYTDSIEAIKLRTLALEEEIKKEKEKLELSVLAADALNTEDIKDNTKKRDKAQTKVDKIKKVLPYFEENDPYTAELYKEQLKKLNKDLEDANSVIQEASKNRRKYLEYEAQETIKTLESNGKEMSDSAKLVVSEFAKSLALEPEDIETQQQALQDFINKVSNSDLDSLIEKYNNFVSAINNGDNSKKNTDGLEKTSESIIKLINTLTKSDPNLKEFAINFASLYPPTVAAKNAIDSLNNSAKDLDFSKITDEIQFLQKALQELSSSDGLSSSSKEKIIEEYPQLFAYMNDEIELRNQLQKIIEESEEKQIDAFLNTKDANGKTRKEMLEIDKAYFNNVIKGNAEFLDVVHKAGIKSVDGFKTIAEAKKEIEVALVKDLSGIWKKYFLAIIAGNKQSEIDLNMDLMHGTSSVKENARKVFNQLNSYNNAIKKLDELINKDVGAKLKTINLGDIKSSKSFEKTFEVWKEALEAINTELEILKDQLNDVVSFEQKTEVYDKMILLLEKKQNLLLEINKTFESSLKQAEQNLRFYIGKGLSESDFNKIISGSTNTIEVDIKNEKIAKAIEDFKKLKDDSEGIKKELQGIDNEIRNLSFDKFKINLSIEDTKLSELTQEKENLRNQMSLLEKGSAEYITLLERENQINIESINVLKNKIALTQQELTSDKYNADQKKEFIDILKQLKQEYINLQFSIKQQLASIADEVIQIYKNIYEKQKQVALDAIDEQMKAEEKRHKQATDNLDDELKQFEDYINAKLKALDKEENEHDYNRELEKKQKAILETQKQIDILSLDDSFEAKAKKAELAKQLAEQEDEIAEYQHDHSVDLRKDNFKDQLDTYKKDIDAKKKAEDTKLNLEKNRLDRIKRETERHYDELINDERKFAQIRSDIINGNIDEVKNAFGSFKTFMNSNLEFIGNSITANLITKMEQAIAVLQSYQSQSNSIPNIPDESFAGGNTGGAKTGLVKPGMLLTEAAAIAGISVVYHPEDNTVTIGDLPTRFSPAGIGGTHLNAQNRIVIDEIENIKRLIKMAGGDVSKFHDGGIVGDKSFGFVDKFNKFFNTSANEHIIKALTNEILIPPKNIEKYLIPNMQKLIANVTPQLQFAGGGNTNYYLNLRIDNVTGDKRGGETVFREVVRGLKSIGK